MKTRTLVDSRRLAGRTARIGTIRSNGVRRRKKSTFSEFCCEEPCCRPCNRFYAERNDSTARCPGEERGQKKLPPLRHAFLFGIARIPHSAKSACSAGTSTYQAIESVSGEKSFTETMLTEKVALVTGGSRGIGAAIAKRLAMDGASVAITYSKDANAASAVVKAIEHNCGKAVAIQADAADVEAVKSAVEKTVANFGRLDVLVNNAGTAIPKTFEETTLEEMDRVININVRGILSTTQGGAEAHEERRPHHLDRIGRRRARPGSGAGSLLGYEGSRKDLYSGVVQRAG